MSLEAYVHSRDWQLVPQGDRTLILQLGSGIDVALGRRCAWLASALRQAHLPGVTDVVPTFNAVALHFLPQADNAGGARLSNAILQVLQGLDFQAEAPDTGRLIDIPVCYGGDLGPDLHGVAEHCGLTPEEVIALHSRDTVYVFMLGFAPGAPYIGVHDERLAIGRRPTPRTVVPPGSVAIANRQSVVYPTASPGGWHIIGATPATLFNPLAERSTLMEPGDSIRFVPIDREHYEALKGQSA